LLRRGRRVLMLSRSRSREI